MSTAFVERILVRFGRQFAEMSIRVWKAPGSRKTLFCVHGFLNNSTEFEYLASYLASHGYNVVCPDLIGRGASGRFQDAKHYSLLNMLKSLGSVVERYGTAQNFMLGSSYGGALGLFAATSGLKLAGLVLNDPPLAPHPHRDAFNQLLAQLCLHSCETEHDFTQWFAQWLETNLGPFQPGGAERFARNNTAKRPHGYGLDVDTKLVGVLAENFSEDFDLGPRLASLDIPALLLFSERSPYKDVTDLSFVHLPGSQTMMIRDLQGGHPPLLLDEDIAARIRLFLDRAA